MKILPFKKQYHYFTNPPFLWEKSEPPLCLKKTENYTPISLLPLTSKVIGKSLQYQTKDYLQRNELLYSYQSRFRANHLTDACLSQLTDMTFISAENA